MSNSFLEDVEAELDIASVLHPNIHSLHEGYALILEELDELWDECRKKAYDRSADNIRLELIQIAAMAWRTARDLRY